jgi:hypothetical protein
MLHFPMKLTCPFCLCWMSYCVHLDSPPAPDDRVTVRCPMHGGPFTIALHTLKQADTCPPDAIPLPRSPQPAPTAPPVPPKRRWFWWW